MNVVIDVSRDWNTVILQLLNTLFLIGLISLFIYLLLKLPKSLKLISKIEKRVYNIEEKLDTIEKNNKELK